MGCNQKLAHIRMCQFFHFMGKFFICGARIAKRFLEVSDFYETFFYYNWDITNIL